MDTDNVTLQWCIVGFMVWTKV